MKIIINGEEISQQVFEQEVQNQRRQNPRLNDDQLKAAAQQSIIDWTIIRQEAKTAVSGIPTALVDNEYAKLLEQHGGEEKFLKNFELAAKDIPTIKGDIEQNIKISQFLQGLAKTVEEPSDAEIAHFYKKNEPDFTLPEQIRAAHIQMKPNPANVAVAYNELKEIRQELLDGADFSAMANDHSSCQDEGGGLGWFSPGHMVEGFDAIVFSMNAGEISPIFLTEFGYHIATVYEKKSSQLKPLDEVRDDVVDRIKTDKGDELIGKWVDEKKQKSEIKVEE
jgi:parvulin-like peptidyl-prolyl isomerase